MPKLNILAITALSTSLHLIIVTIVVCVTAPLLFDAPTPVNWGNFAIVFLATLIACAGLGVLIGVISPNSRATILLSQLIFLPSMLIGGMMVPYSLLPRVAQMVAQLLPTSHAMNAFKGLAMGQTADFSPWGSVIVLLAGGVVAFGLAYILFRWDNQHTTSIMPCPVMKSRL